MCTFVAKKTILCFKLLVTDFASVVDKEYVMRLGPDPEPKAQ